MGSKKIDWDRVEIVTEPAGDPNPKNPYAEVDEPHRRQALRELARTVLLRKADVSST